MATKKRRPKRRRKKTTGLLIKWGLGIIAVLIIGVFAYNLIFSDSVKTSNLEKALKLTCKQTLSKNVKITKTFDEKANLVYKLSVPKEKYPSFIKTLKKTLPSSFEYSKVKAGNKILLKIDSGKEVQKLLISLYKTKKTEKKTVKHKYQYEEPLPKKPVTKRKKKTIKIKGQPLLAIIIDDCGIGHMNAFEKAITIPYPITFAILPFRTYSKKCAFLANGRGYQVILHMPMEPLSYPKADPGPGAILKTDNKKEIVSKLSKAFANITFAKGFNNHMGSSITESRFAVRVILTYAEKHGKFFIDSRTTSKSVVEEEAEKMGIKVLSRDVFLDNDIDYSHIRKQLNEAVKKAYQHGYAIAIGHNYPKTIEVLSEAMPELDKKVNFVFIRDIYNANY